MVLNRILLKTFIAVSISGFVGCTGRHPESSAPSNSTDKGELRTTSEWPDLPTEGFVSGRPATSEDLDAGRALFAAPEYLQPISIDIPQYAKWHGDRVIVIQAESGGTSQGGTMDLLTLRRVADGALFLARRDDVQLLGQEKPAD